MVESANGDMAFSDLPIPPQPTLDEEAVQFMRYELLDQFSLITEEMLALMVGVTLDTLQQWRANRLGPAYIKLGRTVFYRKDDIRDWIKESVVWTPTLPR